MDFVWNKRKGKKPSHSIKKSYDDAGKRCERCDGSEATGDGTYCQKCLAHFEKHSDKPLD